MPRAIITKFLPPTEHRPARMKATCGQFSVTMSDASHNDVAKKLAENKGWLGTWVLGEIKAGSYAYVHISRLPVKSIENDMGFAFHAEGR